MKNNIISGTIILTIATIIIRLLGFIFRIYLANTIGAEGMGVYQLIMSVDMLASTLAISGISVAVSRIVSEEIAKKKFHNVRKCLIKSSIICLITGGIAAILLFYGAKFISTNIIKDSRSMYPILYLAPSMPFLALSACFRGYFYASKSVVKPSSAQFIEQVTRIYCTIILLSRIDLSNISKACGAVTIGMTVGEVVSFIYIYLLYTVDKNSKNKAKSTEAMTKRILGISVPVASTHYLNSILRMVENALIPAKLVAYGMTYSAALSLYGVLKGMVLPLLFFPTSFLTSLATVLLPSISGANAVKNDKQVRLTVGRVINFTLIISIVLVGIFIFYPNELGSCLYKNKTVGPLIQILSFICPFMYLNMICTAVLNALGCQVTTFKINVLESIIKISIIVLLVPIFGFKAYMLALLLSTIINTVLYMTKLLKVSQLNFDITNWINKPVISAFIAGFFSKVIYSSILIPRFGSIVSLVVSIFLLSIMYLVLLIYFKCISKDDFNKIKQNLKFSNTNLR